MSSTPRDAIIMSKEKEPEGTWFPTTSEDEDVTDNREVTVDEQIAELQKSISGHQSWLTRYRKTLDHYTKHVDGFSEEKSNDLAEKIARQHSKIEEKLEILLIIYERNNYDTGQLNSQLDGITDAFIQLIGKSKLSYPAVGAHGEGEKTEATCYYMRGRN